ncbi:MULTISPECIES: TAXI family TRAP transporter solute-binding subunit [unclassified Microbacterium]|uniref:TAXI family TRAP transporter solute-binding subunit n=1 Tax=unclassified Microbacterium TaxID=2609290 RepID=UPI003414489E
MRNGRRLRTTRRLVAAALVLVTAALATGCGGRSDGWGAEPSSIAGGGPDGVYFAYGTRLAEELSARFDLDVSAEQTAGSVDNLLRVASGESLLGFAQGDAAADAVAGVGAFAEPLPVQAVARLYDEYLHVVVREDSDIDELADLTGRTVSLGAENSGVNVIASRVLDAADVDVASIDDPQLGLGDSIRALEDSTIDGFFWVGGIPTPGIAELARTTPVRLLPIEQAWVADVNERYSHAYRQADLPVGLYGIAESEPTLAVPNYLVTAADTPDGVVRDVLDALFGARTSIAHDVPVAAFLDRTQAIFTGPVPLHPGAVAYFRSQRD